MDNKTRIRVTLGLGTVGLILGIWAYNKMPLEGATKGRVYFVLGLYGVALLYALWEMFKPSGVRLPEYNEDNFILDQRDTRKDGDWVWMSGLGWSYFGDRRGSNKDEFDGNNSEEKKRPEKRKRMVR